MGTGTLADVQYHSVRTGEYVNFQGSNPSVLCDFVRTTIRKRGGGRCGRSIEESEEQGISDRRLCVWGGGVEEREFVVRKFPGFDRSSFS
jgi:hypothetical protein